MTQRTDLPLLSYFGNVADPQVGTDAATKNYVDNRVGSNSYYDQPTQVTTLAVAVPTGASSITVAGDQVGTFGATGGAKFFFGSSNTTIYTSTSATYSSGTNQTIVGQTPSIITAQAINTPISTVARLQFTDITPGSNISGSVVVVDNNQTLVLNAYVSIVETAWRTVNTNAQGAIVITDNVQSPQYVFSGNSNLASTFTLTTGTTSANWTIPAGSTIRINVSGGVVNGIITNTPVLTISTATDFISLIATPTFLNAFFTSSGFWRIDTSQLPTGNLRFIYTGIDNPIVSGTPQLSIIYTGAWSPAPTFSTAPLVQSGGNQAPSFKALTSLQVSSAINGSPTANQVVGWDATNARLAWLTQNPAGVSQLNTLTGNISITAGTGISIQTLAASGQIQIVNTGSGSGGTLTPVINFTGATPGAANQAFTNSTLSNYPGADNLSVTVNGATLNRSNYTLSGTTLTITAYLPAAAAVQVQPSGGGGAATNAWLLGGNTLTSTSYLGTTNRTTFNIGVANIPLWKALAGFTTTNAPTTTIPQTPLNNFYYWADDQGQRVWIGTNPPRLYSSSQTPPSDTFTQNTNFTSTAALQVVAQGGTNQWYLALSAQQNLFVIYSSGINSYFTQSLPTTFRLPSGFAPAGWYSMDVSLNNNVIGASFFSSSPADSNYFYWATYSNSSSTLNIDNQKVNLGSLVNDIFFDPIQNSIAWVFTAASLVKVNTATGTYTTIAANNVPGQVLTAFLLGNIFYVAVPGGLYQCFVDAPTPTFSLLYNLPNQISVATEDTVSSLGPRIMYNLTTTNAYAVILNYATQNEFTQPVLLGQSTPQIFNTPLLLGNAITPTNASAGAPGQIVASRGPSRSPYWASLGNFTAYFSVPATVYPNTNVVILWPNISNNLNWLTYDSVSGAFTATRAGAVTIGVDVAFNLQANSQGTAADLWFSYNGDASTGTRVGHVDLVENTATTYLPRSFVLHTSWPFYLNASDTVRVYFWSNPTASFDVGSAVGGSVTRISIVELNP